MILALVLAAWPAPGAKVHMTLQGQFDARAPFEVNRVNGPPVGGPQEPPPLPLKPEVLQALNASVSDATDAVLRSLNLEPLHGDQELQKLRRGAKPLSRGQGDARFALSLQLAGDDGLGGHHGGLELRARVRSLQRAPDLAGEGVATVPFVVDVHSARIALGGALLDAISSAFNDLRSHLHDDQTRPRVHVKLLLVDTAALSHAQQAAALERARCAAELAEPVSVQPLPDGAGYDVELRLGRYDPAETTSQRVKAWAGRLQLELGPEGKARCSTWHTPLEGLQPLIVPDADALRLGFEPPQDAGP